jgi:type VI protein secretion system component Hcp
MAKPKKDRAKGKKAVGDLAAKDVAAAEAQTVSGGKASPGDFSFVHLYDKASPVLAS